MVHAPEGRDKDKDGVHHLGRHAMFGKALAERFVAERAVFDLAHGREAEKADQRHWEGKKEHRLGEFQRVEEAEDQKPGQEETVDPQKPKA